MKLHNAETLKQWQEIDAENWKVIVGDLLDLFLKSGPVQYAQLQEARTHDDLLSMSRAAHSLKSSCGNVGCERAQDLLYRIEKASKNGLKTEVSELLVELDGIFLASLQEIRKYQAALAA